MCLIIRKPPGRHISPAFLSQAWRHNADGWGTFHVHQGSLVVQRSLCPHALHTHNAQLPDGLEVFIHLRKATYGAVNHDMAHPHRVRDGLYLMHNGSIPQLAPTDPQLSDTAVLAATLRDLLQGLNDEQAAALVRTKGFATLVAPLIEGSMVILLDQRGAVRLGREWHTLHAALWHEPHMLGIEVSNTHTWTDDAKAVTPSTQEALSLA